jgi:Ca2+/Na+ antiporter
VKKILREYRLEITGLIIALLGIFLVSQRGKVESFLRENYFQLSQYLSSLNQTVQADLQRSLQRLSFSEMVGWLLVLLAVPFVIYRLRYRFSQSEHWRATVCPRCGSEMHRIHRRLIDRLLSRTLMPHARRYQCTNAACHWSGLRRRRDLDQAPSTFQEAIDSP